MKRLAFFFVLLAAPAFPGEVCSSNVLTTCGGTSAGGALTSPITLSPVSATGVWTFDNAANTPLTCSDGLVSPTLAAPVGSAEAVSSTAPVATTGASQAGKPVTVTASGAVASTDTAGAAAGGAITLSAGAAARFTSGNANGGNVNLSPGAGIGTGTTGSLVLTTGTLEVPNGTAALPSLRFGGLAGAYLDSGTGGLAVSTGAAAQVIYNAQFEQHRSDAEIQWMSTATPVAGTRDLNILRSSAGVLQVGTGLGATGFGTMLTGGINFDRTITAAGTTGAQTINKSAGTVNFAAAATTLVVTDSFITANSLCSVRARTSDATCSVKDYEPAAGSMTIRMNAACTAETSVGFICFN